MKKSLVALTIATALVSIASAQTNTAISANVVGYKRHQTPSPGSFGLIALTQFSDGTTNNTYNIQTIINNLENLNSAGLGSNMIGADKLYIYTGSGYAQYALFSNGSSTYWASVNEGGWTSGLEFLGVNPAAVSIARGTACWLATASTGFSTNIISSGDVLLDDTYNVTVSAGFSLLAYPYSSNINLSNLVIDGATGAGLGSSMTGADKLYVYTGSGYAQYALFDNGAGTKYWASVNEGGWTPGLEFLGINPANAEIEMGKGFWFSTAIGKTLTFNKIYSIN